MSDSSRGTWASRSTFILAAIGSAVGLGNAWRFPGLCAKHGGGAFMLVYLAAMLVIGIPLLTMEIAIGRKAVEYFQRRNVRILAEFENIGEDITVYKALDIAERIVTLYEKGDVQAVELIYTNYVSPLVQEAHHMHVMPVEHLEHAPGGYHALTTYEPSPEAVFDALIPKYLAGMLYCAVIESFAAEQAARRLAMENATDNATEMITDLSLVYNRARQSAITQEITEIVSGANAQS